MEKIFIKNKYKCPANIIAIFVNAILLLIAPPSDLGDWVFKIIELIAFINILISSWKWRFTYDIPISKLFNDTQVNK